MQSLKRVLTIPIKSKHTYCHPPCFEKPQEKATTARRCILHIAQLICASGVASQAFGHAVVRFSLSSSVAPAYTKHHAGAPAGSYWNESDKL